MKTVEVPEQFLKDLYKIKCVPDLKVALEKHFGEVVKPGAFSHEPGEIFISKSDTCEPYVCKGKRNGLVSLKTGHHHNLYESQENELYWRPMRSGTITLKVFNGKVAGATVQED